MKTKRYDPKYHLELSARAQLLGVREGDPDETRTLLHGFVEEAVHGAEVEPETLDLVAWMIGRVLDGEDPARVFCPPDCSAQEADADSARQRLQKRRQERMIRLVAEDARDQLRQGGKEKAVVATLSARSKLPEEKIRSALKATGR